MEILVEAARGMFRVIFVCPEMLESPTFAQVLHAASFQDLLGCIYVDEAHLVHESHEWRSPYSRLAMLRKTVGWHVPLVAISATLPSLYRASLCQYIALRDDYLLINCGNHRPELSMVVLQLQHEAASFQDLAFTIPPASQPSTIPKSLIYCDDLDMLTSMYWWYRSRLMAMGLPTSLVDILHAGLSQIHEDKALDDFERGNTRILLGSEKIGAGLNFSDVEAVIQYLIKRGLTIAKLSQRRGRGARIAGTTAIGYLLYQRNIGDTETGELENEGTIDPGLMELVRTTECHEKVIDRWLENPDREEDDSTLLSSTRHCCSNCFPSLLPAKTYQWVSVDLGTGEPGMSAVPKDQRGGMLEKLKAYRLEVWKSEWRNEWPGFGPTSLVSDLDLESMVKHAHNIKTSDDLRRFIQVPYFDELSPWLLKTLHQLLDINDGDTEPVPTTAGPSNTATPPTVEQVSTPKAVPKSRQRAANVKLHHGEQIIDFGTE